MTICNYCRLTEHYFRGLLDPRQIIKTTHCIYCDQLFLENDIEQKCFYWKQYDSIYWEPTHFISRSYCIACKRDDMIEKIFSNNTILHCNQCDIPLNTYPTLRQFALVAIRKTKKITTDIIETILPQKLQYDLNNLMVYKSNRSINSSTSSLNSSTSSLGISRLKGFSKYPKFLRNKKYLNWWKLSKTSIDPFYMCDSSSSSLDDIILEFKLNKTLPKVLNTQAIDKIRKYNYYYILSQD